MNIPDTLKYSTHHLWVRVDSDIATVGITDHAQELLGDVVFVQAPEVGATITAGEPCGVVESVKTASDLVAPLSGEVSEINPALADAPEQLNEAPYDAWIFRLNIVNSDEADALLSATDYRQLLADD